MMQSTSSSTASIDLDELCDLRQALVDGYTEWRTVADRIEAVVPQPPDNSTEAFLPQDQFVTGVCSLCMKSNQPVSTFRTWLPQPVHLRIAAAERAYVSQARFEFERKNPLPGTLKREGGATGCPRCGSTDIRDRLAGDLFAGKGTDETGMVGSRYACLGMNNGQPCRHEFSESVPVAPTDRRERWRAIQAWQSQASAYVAERYSQNVATVRTFAVLEALDDVEAYLRGKGLVTYCDTCAYLWHNQRLVLCRKCGQQLHPSNQLTCDACRKNMSSNHDQG